MKKIKWGMISTGMIAHTFAQDFPYAEGGELLAVASREGSKAKAFADQYAIPKAYGSYAELFLDSEIDAVYIATPHNSHLEYSRAALEAGKAVMCEKPITVNPAECQELITCANSNSRYLMEAMWTYFLPAIRTAKAWVDAGRIGKIMQIKADFGYPKPYDPKHRLYDPELAGGGLLDMGIYPIAMANLFLGPKPDRLFGFRHNAPNGVDDETHFTFAYGESVAVLGTSFRTKLQNHLFICGDKGTIQVPDFWRSKECVLFDGESEVHHFTDPSPTTGFNFQIEAVNKDLLAGRVESEIVTHQTSIDLQNLIANVFKEVILIN